MIALALAASIAMAAPVRLHIKTAHGAVDIPVVHADGRGGPMISLNALARALAATVARDASWVTLQTDSRTFRFLAGTPLVRDAAELRGMAGSSRAAGDSLLVPLAFISDVFAGSGQTGWRWIPATGVLSEVANVPRQPARRDPDLLPSGLRRGHHVTIDPGHGGVDPGNPGKYFPRGMHEKDVTLAVGLLVRDDLERAGVSVTMTRTTDTLINLMQRAPGYCTGKCDLFASIHVNSLDPRPGYTRVRGFETYFLSDARSADAARVARMENDAVRFDNPADDVAPLGDLAFMFKDLQNNEYQRESQRAAAMIQSLLGEVNDGTDHGVKQAGFAVLRTARRPAVLIEIGFATNRDDARLMTTPAGQQDLAHAIARAIIRYLQAYDRESADTTLGTSP